MKIKVLRNTACKGKHLEKGKVVKVDDTDAKYLIAVGKAEAVSAKGDKEEKKS